MTMERLWAPWRLEYVQGPREDHCIFCVGEETAEDASRHILYRGQSSYVIMNRYPYSNGHLMVAPYRHTADLGDLEDHEALEIHHLLVMAQQVLRESCRAQGFNIGWNIGTAAGAGIAEHIHLHLVPRWSGDTNYMTVCADVRIVPDHLETSYRRLLDCFSALAAKR